MSPNAVRERLTERCMKARGEANQGMLSSDTKVVKQRKKDLTEAAVFRFLPSIYHLRLRFQRFLALGLTTRGRSISLFLKLLLTAMADLAALQTKLQAFNGLTARPEQHPVAVGVAAELLHRRLLQG